MRIKALREACGWTQEVPATKARVSRVTIGRIEIGHSRAHAMKGEGDDSRCGS